MGFTLIELLVVIAVIALLMAILLPVLGKVRKQARAVVCRSNLKQWGQAMALYSQESEGRLPARFGSSSGIWFLRGGFPSDQDVNAPGDSVHHFDTEGIVCCPMATKASGSGQFSVGINHDGVDVSMAGVPGSAFAAWEISTPPPAFRGSYGYNAWLSEGFCIRPRLVGRKVLEVDIYLLTDRANIPVFLDGTFMWAQPRDMDRPPRKDSGSGIPTMHAFCMNRHGRNTHGLFLDWSARPVGLKELWTLKWHAEFDRANRWTKAGGVQPGDWPEWMQNSEDY